MVNLFTIGYANKHIDEFIRILLENKIDCIVDVRSVPYSRQYPEYNENNIINLLNENKIKYLSFKNEFGARRDEDYLYSKITTFDNKNIEVVDFKKVWDSPLFLSGVTRIINGLEKKLNICFMCSEKQAYDCHRGLMISEYFYTFKKINVKHLIDSTNFYYHDEMTNNFKEFFENEHKKFVKKNSEYILYGDGLFSLSLIKNSNVDYWSDFFKSYNYEKGFALLNYKVGYKKGDETND